MYDKLPEDVRLNFRLEKQYFLYQSMIAISEVQYDTYFLSMHVVMLEQHAMGIWFPQKCLVALDFTFCISDTELAIEFCARSRIS